MTVTESLSQIIRLPGANVLFEAGRGAVGVDATSVPDSFKKNNKTERTIHIAGI